jgi:hypothetical protein
MEIFTRHFPIIFGGRPWNEWNMFELALLLKLCGYVRLCPTACVLRGIRRRAAAIRNQRAASRLGPIVKMEIFTRLFLIIRRGSWNEWNIFELALLLKLSDCLQFLAFLATSQVCRLIIRYPHGRGALRGATGANLSRVWIFRNLRAASARTFPQADIWPASATRASGRCAEGVEGDYVEYTQTVRH